MVPALLGVLEEWQSAPEPFPPNDPSWLRLNFSAFLLAQPGRRGPSNHSSPSSPCPAIYPRKSGEMASPNPSPGSRQRVRRRRSAPPRRARDSTIDEFVRGGTIVDCYSTLVTNDLLPRERVESYFASFSIPSSSASPPSSGTRSLPPPPDLGFTLAPGAGSERLRGRLV